MSRMVPRGTEVAEEGQERSWVQRAQYPPSARLFAEH